MVGPADDAHARMTVWGTWKERFGSTPFRTFVFFPIAVFAYEIVSEGAGFSIMPFGLVFLVWGYAQYRLTGNYRIAQGGGGPGIAIPPERLVMDGPYKYVRNPMYLGHLIFIYGLVLTFKSAFALLILLFHVVWFHRRVLADEIHMQALFGRDYEIYAANVKRWIPGVF